MLRGKSGHKVFTEQQKIDFLNAFKFFDKTGSGTVTAQDVGYVMNSIGVHMPIADLASMVAEADEDGNGEIDFEEFL